MDREETIEETVEEPIEEDSKEQPTQTVLVDELTEQLGETNHLYEDRDELSQDDIAWEHRKRELVEQEIFERIESEEENLFTRDILDILHESDTNGANIRAETEALTLYLIENTDSFNDRLYRGKIKHYLESGRSQSDFFQEETSSEEPETSRESVADTADKAVIVVCVAALSVFLFGMAFAGAGITISGMSLLTFTGKIAGVLTTVCTLLFAISGLADRE